MTFCTFLKFSALQKNKGQFKIDKYTICAYISLKFEECI